MIPGLSVKGDVRRIAAARGLAPTAAQVEQIEALAQSLGSVDDAGQVAFDHNGSPVDFATFCAARLGGMNVPVSPTREDRPPATRGTGTISADGRHVLVRTPNGARWIANDALGALVTGFQQAEHQALAREAATWPNPFKAGPEFNRTRQVIIQKTDPAKAERFKSEAAR